MERTNMSDQVPSQPPPGYKWIKTWLGFGPWQLVLDQENPLPPPGYRWAINFWTAKKELVRVVGQGVDFGLGDNSRPQPAPTGAADTQALNFGTAGDPCVYKGPVRESGNGVDGIKDDPTCRPAPGSDVYSVEKRNKGIFG